MSIENKNMIMPQNSQHGAMGEQPALRNAPDYILNFEMKKTSKWLHMTS
jgi:hypothetical protein